VISLFKSNKIYTQDAISFLESVPRQTVDLAVIDPPYNMSKADWDTFKSQGEFMKFTQDWIDALIPTLKQTGSLYIFNTPFNSAYILQYLVSKGLVFQNWITWDKRDGLNSSTKRFTHGQETILFFTVGKTYTFNSDAVRVPYESEKRIEAAKVKGILKNGKRWFPNPDGRLCGEVWHFSSERHKTKQNGKTTKTEHITPKPSEMIERIILASSNQNDLVLDCFMGSGTTAVSAKKLSRSFTGSEINPSYVKLANKRLKEF
jgi:site-specific DNA-methyltransferase (adenine-specific)